MANNAGDQDTENLEDVNLEDEELNGDDAAEDTEDDDAGNSDDDGAADDADDDQGADDDAGADDDDAGRSQRGKSHINRVTEERNYYRALARGENPEKPEWIKDKPAKSDKPAPKSKSSKIDDATLARLEVRGVLHPDDQAYVAKFAKTEGISVVAALDEQIVKDRLAANKRTRDQGGSTTTPNNRVGAGNNKNVAFWVKKVQGGGALPNDPELAAKVQDELAKQSRAGR